MPFKDRDIALKAFSTPEWRSAADALFQATGVTVNTMDFGEKVNLSAGQKCAYCHLATDIDEPGPLTCFDNCPAADASNGRVMCRAGLPSLYAPVKREGRVLGHVVLSGFVTSTRERRGLYEHLLSKGVTEDAARRTIKALPVISRRQAESYLDIAVASASTVADATAERLAAAERVDELRLFVSAGQQVVSTERLDADTLGGIADEAVELIGGEAGAILRPRGMSLEVVAKTGTWRGPIGALVPRASTAAGRALETKRTVVSAGAQGGAATLAMPLTVSDRVIAVLEVRVAASKLPLPKDRLVRLNRFGQFVAIALEREDERTQVERAMTGYAWLNELAATLGGQSDIDGVTKLVVSVIEKAFTFEVAGLVLTGWGRDSAEVVVSGRVASTDVDHVLGIVAGRDVASSPFGRMRYVTHLGSVEDIEPANDWAIVPVEVSYGDLTVGWMFCARSDGERYNAQDSALLNGIAAHAGAALGRAALFSRIRDDYAKTIAALSATLDFGERAPSGHAGRVMDYAMLIGQELGLSIEEVEQLRFSGLLHDIGKSGLPEEILLKPSALTNREMEEMQRHAEIGASIIDQIEFLKSLTPIILHHHERWDGNGYPGGLSADDIPLLARVLSVADSYDAMTSERSYRKRLTIAQARLELEAGAGTQFDPMVVAALLEVLERQGTAGSLGLFADRNALGRKDLPA